MSMTAREAYSIYLSILQDDVFEDFTSCKDCIYCEETKDGYATGDSPTLYECKATPEECAPVQMQVN